MGLPRQEYWSGLPFPSPGDLPKPGTEPESPTLQGDSLLSQPPGKETLLTCGTLKKGKKERQNSHPSAVTIELIEKVLFPIMFILGTLL